LSITGAVGQRTRRQVQLVARGDSAVALADITVAGADAARFSLLPGNGCAAGKVLAPAVGCTLVWEFTPARSGLHQAVLRVQPAGGAAAVEVALTALAADALGPLLQVDATRLDFGEQAAGSRTAVQRVVLFNAGTAPWLGAAIAVTGTDAGSFPLAGTCAVGQALEVGEHCTVDVGFASPTSGLRQATLLLQGADDAEPAQVGLIGRAVAAGAPRLQADTTWLQFPPLRPGGTAAAQVIVRNQGSAAAPVPALSLVGPFRIARQSPACLAALAPGAHCTLGLAFEPASPGTASGRLDFDGAAGVALRGEAIDAPTPRLRWQAAPDRPSHGTAAVGGVPSASGFLTLVNSGDADTGPLAFAFFGAHAGDFSLDPAGSCRAGTVLAPRRACSLRVAFHPSAAGARTSTLRVQGGLASAELPLDGRGRAEAVGLLTSLPKALWFDAAAGPVPTALFWHNGGPAALRVASLGLRGEGFSLQGGGCPAPPFVLQAGQACDVGLAWNGGADARFGAELVARVDGAAALAVPLALVEDPGQRSNVGGGGGFAAAWVLALALAGCALRRAESSDG
jgi:hypothetical protein